MPRADIFANDCLAVFPHIESESIDLVCADPPYGTTENEWDSVIPLKVMWDQLRRVVKPQGAIVLTASQPFTTTLIASAPDLFKYEWIWQKNIPTGHVHAKNKPMKRHENVLVFSKATTLHEGQSKRGRMNYYPQGVRNHEVKVRGRTNASNTVMGTRPGHKENFDVGAAGYPDSILTFDRAKKLEHQTQKPVDLFAYLIRTYSQPGEVVMDFCMGSGTTGVAALMTGRAFIGVEQDARYFAIAERRCREAVKGAFFGKGEVHAGIAPVPHRYNREVRPGRYTRKTGA